MIGNNKTALIIPYFGRLPVLAKYFFASCRNNPDFDFLFFTDQSVGFKLPENVFLSKLTLKEFNRLTNEKTGNHFKIKFPYKLCDFKPLYGEIFSDYLKDYTFWGYCDLDMIFGRISDFITPDILNGFDIITAKPAGLAGNFTLYKNEVHINSLFRQSDSWTKILSNWWRMYSFSEKFKKCGVPVSKGYYYRLSVFLKKNCIERVKHGDINQIASNFAGIRIFYGDLMNSDILLKNRSITNWQIEWQGSSLKEKHSGKELMYFHVYNLKSQKSYSIPDLDVSRELKSVTVTDKSIDILYL